MQSVPAALESDGIYYTNRCGNARNPGCNRALTKLEITDALGVNPKRHSICPCGSNNFRSANFKWWEEWLLLRSWKLKREIRKGTVPPPPTKASVAALEQAIMESVIRMEADLAGLPGEDDDDA